MKRIFVIGMSSDKGGVESYITNICSRLNKQMFEIVYQLPEMTIDGKKWVSPLNRHRYLKYRRFWKLFYRDNKFDVLYMNTCDIVSIDQLRFAKAARVPVRIIHSHSTGNQQEINKKMSLFHRVLERHSRKVLDRYATHLLACSEAAGEWMFDGRSFSVIKNGIDLLKYRYNEHTRERLRASLGIAEGKLIGIIGRLDPEKNPTFSLKVVQRVLSDNADFTAVFVGDGELRRAIESSAKKADLEGRVIFTGAVDNVNEWLSAIDCLLMPSLFEGLPFVLVEAQAAGLPCVISTAVSEEANI